MAKRATIFRRWRRQSSSTLRQPWILPTMLSLLLVGLLTASALLWLGSRQQLDEAPLAVARQEAQNFFTLDYRHIDENLDRVESIATGPFKQQFAKKRDQVKKAVVGKKLRLTATIPDNGTAIEYEHGYHAQVLVAVNATTRTETGGADNNRYRARVQLIRQNGNWRVSGVNQVG